MTAALAKRPAHRPCTYHDHEEALKESILRNYAKGDGIAAVARDIGVTRQTIWAWSKKFPELSNLLEQATDVSLAWWEGKAKDAAIEGTGSAPMFKLLMTNKFRADYRENHHHQVEVNTGSIEMDYTGFELEGEYEEIED